MPDSIKVKCRRAAMRWRAGALARGRGMGTRISCGRRAQGHLRLVLAAIVHNAMAQKACLRALPLFRALAAAMRASAYCPLLTHPPAEASPKAEARRALTQKWRSRAHRAVRVQDPRFWELGCGRRRTAVRRPRAGDCERAAGQGLTGHWPCRGCSRAVHWWAVACCACAACRCCRGPHHAPGGHGASRTRQTAL